MSAFIEEARIAKGLVKPAEPVLVSYKVVIMPHPVVPVPKIVTPKPAPKVQLPPARRSVLLPTCATCWRRNENRRGVRPTQWVGSKRTV
jgi:hypothetical protein